MKDESLARHSSFIPHPSSLLVIRLSAFGDVLHTLPAVVALRDKGHEIAWVVERAYADLVRIVAGVDTIGVSMKRWGRAFVSSRNEMLAARAAMRGFDVAIDFQGLIKSASLAWLSGAKTRYGFDRAAIREKPAGAFLNQRVAVDQSKHVVEWNVQLAQAVEPSIGGVPDVDLSSFAADPEGRLGGFAGRVVLLPGAGRPSKLWGGFAELARRIGPRALVAWGPGEEELARSVGAEMAPPTTLRELAFLLREAALVVAGDTGPLHLAAALHTPVLGLYGPTNPARNGPWGQLDRVIVSPDGTMAGIGIDEVFERVRDLQITAR